MGKAWLGLAAVVLGATAWAGEAPPPALGERYLELARKRQGQIARLEGYIRRGVYPRNTDFPGEFMPYFVDRKGTPCAVAYLMKRDGESGLVAQVTKANNQVRVMQIPPGPAQDWILHSGLTQEECAMVQPTYGWGDGQEQDRWKREHPGEEPPQWAPPGYGSNPPKDPPKDEPPKGDPPSQETPPVWKGPAPPTARGDGEKEERERVRAHLQRALDKLKEDTHVSLPVCLQRLMPGIRKQIQTPGLGFFVEKPVDKGQRILRNGSPVEARVRWVAMDRQGEARQEGPWLALKAGESKPVPVDKDRWLFVEWQSDAMQSGSPVSVRILK